MLAEHNLVMVLASIIATASLHTAINIIHSSTKCHGTKSINRGAQIYNLGLSCGSGSNRRIAMFCSSACLDWPIAGSKIRDTHSRRLICEDKGAFIGPHMSI